MSAYYNDNEPFVAAWLRNLIAAGYLPSGDVDERPIQEVKPDDLRPYRQAHFFAGIGGWPYALRLAGWPDDRPVWTGSCPCQPFSVAGRRRGADDARHLWPEWFRLIRECRPATCFGEQVASADGRTWLAAVRADLESVGYAVGAADLPACGVGAPHRRQRLWFVADAQQWAAERHGHGLGEQARGGEGTRHQRQRLRAQSGHGGDVGELVHALGAGLEGHAGHGGNGHQPGRVGAESGGPASAAGAGAWADLLWLPCRDGKWRPAQPGLLPLAHGLPGRVGRLRALGNAIVPQVAAEVVKAYLDCRP